MSAVQPVILVAVEVVRGWQVHQLPQLVVGVGRPLLPSGPGHLRKSHRIYKLGEENLNLCFRMTQAAPLCRNP